jgi:hypothetical protein
MTSDGSLHIKEIFRQEGLDLNKDDNTGMSC